MEEEQFYENIRKAMEELPGNFNILEEQIDVEVQMKFFDYAKKIRKKAVSEKYFEHRDELFVEETGEERKKEILAAIAGLDDVKAYRTLERFVEETEGEIREWGVLALQESRMLLQSSLLDEQQFFISTGLGGKGKKLRYYVVFIHREREVVLTKTQRKLLKDELIFELKHQEGEFESMDFMEGFSSALVMLPLNADIKKVFQNVVDECNQYGNFLHEDLIITNVKVLNRSEIIELLEKNEGSETEGEDLSF